MGDNIYKYFLKVSFGGPNNGNDYITLIRKNVISIENEWNGRSF